MGDDLISCKYCGKIVKRGHNCPNKPKWKRKNSDSRIDKFRSSARWTRKSIEIRQRDKYLCQVCLTGKHQTIDLYNYKSLEVHHIEPLEENWDKRLDNDNLITLCHYHHTLADKGEITRKELYEILSPLSSRE